MLIVYKYVAAVAITNNNNKIEVKPLFFLNLYTMYINIPAGTITLGEDTNSKIEYTYSYKDGAPSI